MLCIVCKQIDGQNCVLELIIKLSFNNIESKGAVDGEQLVVAQLQVNGVDMNASGLSKLEGQIRYVTDVELVALADILEVSVDYLLGREN